MKLSVVITNQKYKMSQKQVVAERTKGMEDDESWVFVDETTQPASPLQSEASPLQSEALAVAGSAFNFLKTEVPLMLRKVPDRLGTLLVRTAFAAAFAAETLINSIRMREPDEFGITGKVVGEQGELLVSI